MNSATARFCAIHWNDGLAAYPLRSAALDGELSMTTTVKVTAHCGADTEVKFGITTVPISMELAEVVTLQDGESAEKVVYDGRIAVVLERKKSGV